MSSVTDTTKSTDRARRWPGAIGRSSEIRILAVALILAAYFEIANHDFLLTSASLENLSQFIAPVAIIACGEIMLMIGGEIDLSAGMVFAFAPFIMHFAHEAGAPTWIALIAGVVAAGVVGLINGAVTVYLRIPSFVTTLGTLFFINGLTLTISHGTPVSHAGRRKFRAPSWALGGIARLSGPSRSRRSCTCYCGIRAGACIRSRRGRTR